MPNYKLTYFKIRGRGEGARLLFAAAGESFEEKIIERSDWPDQKAKMPQGNVPVLEVDGKVTICQSMAINRYLAREFNLYGKGNLEMAVVDQILDTCLDMFLPMLPLHFNPDKEKRAQLLADYTKEKVPTYLRYIENLMVQTGKDGYSVGSSLTVTDLVLFSYLENCQLLGCLVDFPLLSQNRETVQQLPRIKKYLDSRPFSEF